jgi:hypothetical protein
MPAKGKLRTSMRMPQNHARQQSAFGPPIFDSAKRTDVIPETQPNIASEAHTTSSRKGSQESAFHL